MLFDEVTAALGPELVGTCWQQGGSGRGGKLEQLLFSLTTDRVRASLRRYNDRYRI